MQNIEEPTPFPIEIMPRIKGFTCKSFVYAIYLSIILVPVIIGILFWQYLYSMWIGFSMFLFCLLISGVVLSKMRINSIPFSQRELNYSTLAVVKWYVGKNICTQKDE